jgi:hypothetical protein
MCGRRRRRIGELPVHLGRHRPAHDLHGVDGKVRVHLELGQPVLLDEAHDLQPLISCLFLTPLNWTMGGWLLVSLNTPPSRIGT